MTKDKRQKTKDKRQKIKDKRQFTIPKSPMNNTTSNKLFEEAKQYIPGGVNSPVRAFKSVGGSPIFIKNI